MYGGELSHNLLAFSLFWSDGVVRKTDEIILLKFLKGGLLGHFYLYIKNVCKNTGIFPVLLW